jgi:serine phosphatase RsbU (regulator of sigma subunit)
MAGMNSPARLFSLGRGDGVDHKAHRCSFHPDRQDLYVRLATVTVFVRDQELSLRFYLNQLGFELARDARLPCGDACLAVSPPDGTALLVLVAPKPGSEEHRLIGRATQVAFLTENVQRKYEEWRQKGVAFPQPPQAQEGAVKSAEFLDLDGNSFFLVEDAAAVREIEEQRREHAAKLESEHMAALELETAREVQARLFPQTQPEVSTLEYCGLCIQARTVGGDYYDYFTLGRDRFGFVIGDISGKGTPAALLMANLQAHLRNLCSVYSSRPYTPFAIEQPQRLLQAVNQLFCENTASRAFATLLFVEYNDATRRLRYANCGHLPALILRSDDALETLDATSTVVGLFDHWECSVGESHLAAGDTLVFYTDGVTESFNDSEEQYGQERLIEALRRNRELGAPDLLHTIVEEVRRFSPQKQHDDITLIAAKCR